jgi:Ca2+-binding RTX toxin-like protein
MMLRSNWLRSLKSLLAPKTKLTKARPWSRPAVLTVEHLESRLAPPVNLSVVGNHATFSSSTSEEALFLLVNDANQLEYSQDGGVTFSQALTLSAMTTITVNLTGSFTTLTVHSSLREALDDTGAALVYNASGIDDLLIGPGKDASQWVLTGPGAGMLNSRISFTGIEILAGNEADDTFAFAATMQATADTFILLGGEGDNTLDYSAYSSAVTVHLAEGNATGTLGILEFQAVIGGAGNDMLTGDDNANTLVGGAGDDTLADGLEADTYVFDADGPLGSDTIIELEEEGDDTLDFSATSVALTLSLGSTTPQVVGPAGSPHLILTLSAANVVENLIGGTGDDALTGNDLDNALEGGAGNDTLIGGLGNDLYVFDATTAPGGDLGSDLIVETDAADAGTDLLDFSANTAAVRVDLGSAVQQPVMGTVAAPQLYLTLSAGNVISHVTGGAGNDTLTGNALDNVFEGGEGDDTYVFDLDNANGVDAIAETDDTGGVDTLDFSATSNFAIVVDLSTVAAQVLANNNLYLLLQTARGVENVTGGAGNDFLIGNAEDNRLDGGAGNDTLKGGTGNDT